MTFLVYILFLKCQIKWYVCILNNEKRVENTTRIEVRLTEFEVFK